MIVIVSRMFRQQNVNKGLHLLAVAFSIAATHIKHTVTIKPPLQPVQYYYGCCNKWIHMVN